MLAVATNVAFSATNLMAGLSAVMLAERVWVATFLRPPDALFDQGLDPWSVLEGLASGYTQGLLGVALMIWLAGCMVRRALRR
jgi:hypothetical protein